MKVPGESFFSVHGSAWAPMSVKTDNRVVSAVDVYTGRDRNVSVGRLVICCEFKYGVVMPQGHELNIIWTVGSIFEHLKGHCPPSSLNSPCVKSPLCLSRSLLLEDDRIGDNPKQCFLVMPIAGLLYRDVGTLV